MTSKHTPCNWSYRGTLVYFDDGGIDLRDVPNAESKARLIAMAPRMYEVLKLARALDVDGYNLLDVQMEADAILNELETDQ